MGEKKATVRIASSVIIFIFIGLILFGCLTNLLRRKTQGTPDMIHSFYTVDRDTLDVIVLGSSHGFASFQPNVLWKEYGLTSYAMCCPKQSTMSSYYLLKEALNYQHPKVVIFETYYTSFEGKYVDVASLRMAFDGIRLGKVKHEMIQDALSDKSWEIKASFYIPFLKYHSRWSEIQEEDFHPDNFLKGSKNDHTIYPVTEREIPDEEEAIPAMSKHYVDKIIELCRENNIEIIAYAAPYGHGNNDEAEEGFISKQKNSNANVQMFEEQGIPFFFYQKKNEIGIDFKKDFADVVHMNTYGATKITRDLGQYLVNHYDFPDHRGDSRYESWDRDYEAFVKQCEEQIEKQS